MLWISSTRPRGSRSRHPLLVMEVTPLRDLFATRYLSAVGLVALVYDHVLTFEDEVSLIWMAPHSIAKWMFLVNRYFVLCMQIALAYVLCGFVGLVMTNKNRCQHTLSAFPLASLLSVCIGNMLVLQRIVILWDRRVIIVKVMIAGFLIGFSAQVITMALVVKRLAPSVEWMSSVGACVITRSTPLLIVLWSSAMLFEGLVLLTTTLNALDRPRTIHERLAGVLRRDGIQYFAVITSLRILNLVLAVFAINRPSLIFLGTFFVWALTTTALSRLLLNLRRIEIGSNISLVCGRSSPFALRLVNRHEAKASVSGEVEVEMDVWTS
ncbi:hypothetical protein OBBRIDRAFT_289258 [Obba rivulosa]|uniref:DUF6533 domain-containing protein n=1 Tax=Obba rivulosa TaxID=1052685 RepID=A0A8E2AK63_9APHY|nr:hypothetical protein OBBRIDRAFT_289258 [Obba rivulosa]